MSAGSGTIPKRGVLTPKSFRIVRSDAASVWATGKTWWQIPPMAKVVFTGSLPNGVTVSDPSRALFNVLSRIFCLGERCDYCPKRAF